MHFYFNFHRLITLLTLLLYSSSIKYSACAISHKTEYHIKSLISWVRSKGGYFSDDIEVRAADEKSSYYGIFARNDIKENELLIKIPKECLITAGGIKVGDVTILPFTDDIWHTVIVTAIYSDRHTMDVILVETGEKLFDVDIEVAIKSGDITMECDTIRNMIKEMKLGDKSEYAPYVNYLLHQNATIPSFWSDAGKDFLLEIQGNLPPSDFVVWSWTNMCQGKKDPLEEKAAIHQLTRGWDDFVVPLYDMMNHRSGSWTNTKNNYMKWNVDIEVTASRDIKSGEQLYNNYLFGTNGDTLSTQYATPELFRDYGFIEQYPQRWFFHEHGGIGVELDESDEDIIGKLIIPDGRDPSDQDIKALQNELDRLLDIKSSISHASHPSIPKYEWDAIHQYLNSAILALTHVIPAAKEGQCYQLKGEALIDCKYDKLDDKNVDRIMPLQQYTCDAHRSMAFFNYIDLDFIESPYHVTIDFFHNPMEKDTCFALGETFQMCSSNRPHVYEMMVHYPARFLNEVKRVLFIGSGDSMLLHEILKYPSLELVVGLEAYQLTTRKSFQYFGTQPHFDQDKVQWWYGDINKSLSILPEEYYESFDLVLIVDLSETGMSIIDDYDTLGSLVKPDGILVMNGLHLEKLNTMFQYILQLHYYDVPIVCSQSLILFSNIDFYFQKQKDHKVTVLWPKYLLDTVDYGIWHGYIDNLYYKEKLCKDRIVQTNEEQDSSPGITMILEIEYSNTKYEAMDDFVKAISNVLIDMELDILSSRIHPSYSMAFIMMRQGYIIFRILPEHHYIAIDIHLWSRFDQMDQVRKNLIFVVSDNEVKTSSFRIISGLYDREDLKRGPMLESNLCVPTTTTLNPSIVDSDIDINVFSEEMLSDTVINETISIVANEGAFKVLVICGHKDEECKTLRHLQKNTLVDEMVEVRTCDNIHDIDDMLDCENQIRNIIMESTTSNELPTLNTLEEGDEVNIGDRVITAISGLGKIVGTIHAINQDLTLHVTFDNGFVISNLKREYITGYSSSNTLFYKQKFRAVYIDAGVPYTMGRIIHNIFQGKGKMIFLQKIFYILSFAVRSDWRKNLFDRFLNMVRFDPVIHVQVEFSTASHVLEMGIISAGDLLMINHLKRAISNIDLKSNDVITTRMRKIQGGAFNFQPEFEPSNSFSSKDYDHHSALKQWNTQKSLGRQTIIQFEQKSKMLLEKMKQLKVGDEVGVNYLNKGQWWPAKIIKVYHEGNFYDVMYEEDNSIESRVPISQLAIFKEANLNAHLNALMLKEALMEALSSVTQVCHSNSQNKINCSDIGDISEFETVSNGVVLVACWSNGTAILSWNRKLHVNVNIFTHDESKDAHNEMANQFVKSIPSLAMIHIDTMPRGVGSVVNFSQEIKDNTMPHWV